MARDAAAAADARAEAAADSAARNAAALAAAIGTLDRVEAVARAMHAAGVASGSSALRDVDVSGNAWALRSMDAVMFKVLDLGVGHIKVCTCAVVQELVYEP
jgi:hypothetical protein